MKTIKIIDLLNKIANGEEVPKKIKWHNRIYIYNKYNDCSYYEEYDTKCMWSGYCFLILNDEVEILDEEEFEDIEEKSVYMDFSCDYWKQAQIDELADTLTRYELAIKKIIRNQKKIIERLENDRN